jgi:Zn-dependent protease
MGGSFSLGRFRGTDFRINYSILIIFAFFLYRDWSHGGLSEAIDGARFLILIFACIVLHEIGHALAAGAYGIRTTQISLDFFGGRAHLTGTGGTPLAEAAIALAGPAVNLVLAGLAYTVYKLATGSGDVMATYDPYAGLVWRLMVVNLFLAVFNLIPAYPLDGGIATRALLSKFMARLTARLVVGHLGQGLAVVLAVYGVARDPLAIAIALFIFLASSAEVAAVRRIRASQLGR